MNQTQGIHKGIHSEQLNIGNPMWEVNTATMQASINNGAGAVNARLCEEEPAAKAPGGQAINFNWDDTNYQKKLGWISANDAMLATCKDFNQDVDNTSYKTIGGHSRAAQDGYSQKSSALSPYDGDILVKFLKHCKEEDKSPKKPKRPRACKRVGMRGKSVFQGKKWQCHRHMVIVCSEKYSNLTGNLVQRVAS